jgi:hypothetical protein
MTGQRATACVVAFFVSFTSSLHAQADNQLRLREDDEKLLRSLLKEFVFAPPADARRVQVRINAPGWRDKAEEQLREGWLVCDKVGDRVYFIDGEWVPAPAKENIEQIDFMAKWNEAYKGQPTPMENRRAFFLDREERPAGSDGAPTLVIAAWLYHVGKKDFAAQVMAHAPANRTDEVAILKRWLARNTFHRMLQCYGQYEDQAALEHGERLQRLYGAEAKQIGQAVPLVDDLRGRRQRGLLGAKAGAELPAAYPNWNRKKKLTYLIDQLDQTPERVPNTAQDGEVRRTELSVHVAALIELGESAIPDLLDVIEKDERLTRCVASPNKWQAAAEVQTVREVALAIACQILRTRHLDPRDADADDYGFRKPDFKRLRLLHVPIGRNSDHCHSRPG